MSKNFSRVKLKNSNLLTTGYGRLTPFYFEDNIPKDRLKMGSGFDIQLMPMLAPAFQDCRAYVHWYYVPERMCHINEEYNAFVSREARTLATLPSYPQNKSYTTLGDIIMAMNDIYRNPGSGSVVPVDYGKKCLLNQLPDYLRIQVGEAADYSLSEDIQIIEPFVAYFKVFLDHYCSTQFNTYLVQSTNADGSYNYYSIPYDDMVFLFSYYQKIGFNTYLSKAVTITLPVSNLTVRPLYILLQVAHVQYGRKGDIFMEMYPKTDETASTTNVGTTIEDLRLNSTVVRFKERLARVGHGAREFYREFFNVDNMDSKLSISRFLGGGRCNIEVNDVLQTSQTNTQREQESALGELAGNGFKKASFGFGKRYLPDYGYIFGLLYVVPKQSYFQGIDELWSRRTADQMYLEAFDSIGDEGIKLRELYVTNNYTTNETILGYVPRFRRYDRAKNEIHGDFCNSLLYWHQSRVLPNTVNASNIRQVFAGPQGLNRIFNYAGIVSEAGEQPIMVFVRNVAKWKRNKRYSPKPRIQ